MSFFHGGWVMITFSTTGSTKRVSRRLQNLVNRQIPYAASKALNATGNVLLAVNKREMKRNFDNPVPYTINAFYMKPARYNNLRMSVRRKDKPAGKHYLDIQHKGGVRPKKGVERLIAQRVAYSGIVGAVIPVPGNGGATRNGGVSMAEVNRAMAGLGASYSSTAYTRNKQRTAESKRATAKRPSQYFVKSNEGGTKGGIYKRMANRKIKKVFHISDAMPRYNSKFPFYPPLVRNAKSYFPGKMRRELRAAMRTARF